MKYVSRGHGGCERHFDRRYNAPAARPISNGHPRTLLKTHCEPKAGSGWCRAVICASCHLRLNTLKSVSRAEREPLRVFTVGCHYFTTRRWPDGGAHGEQKPPGAFPAFCRLGLGTTEEVFSMCDYSLHNVKSRPAKVGDRLTTHHFNTGTIGVAARKIPAQQFAFFRERSSCLPER